MIDMAARNWCGNASFRVDEVYTCNRVQELTFLISYAIVGVVMFFGNSFVCLVSLASKKLRRNFMNIFVSSLPVPDMLMALLIVPFYTVHCFRDKFTLFNNTLLAFEEGQRLCYDRHDVKHVRHYLRSLPRHTAAATRYGLKMTSTRLRVGVILTFVWLIPVVVAATRNFWYHSADGEEHRHVTVKLYDVAVVIVALILFQTVVLAVNIQFLPPLSVKTN